MPTGQRLVGRAMQRSLRLWRGDDFARLRREGRAYRHALLVLSVAPGERAHNRYGFITSRRLGKAVVRNRARRLLREGVRRLHPGLRQGYDMVVIARHPIVGQPYHAVEAALRDCLCRADLLVDPLEDDTL